MLQKYAAVVTFLIVHLQNHTSNGNSADTNVSVPVFMHISDIDGEYIPRKGDRVRYQTCPMPPRFDKPQVRRRSYNIKIQNQSYRNT